MGLVPEGWNEHALGFAKWFGDHWKFAPDAKEARRLDDEVKLRTDGAAQQASAEADALRVQADVTDPAVDTASAPGSNQSPEPESTVATATVVPTDAEQGSDADTAGADVPEQAPADTAETPAPEAPAAEPTPTEGA